MRFFILIVLFLTSATTSQPSAGDKLITILNKAQATGLLIWQGGFQLNRNKSCTAKRLIEVLGGGGGGGGGLIE